MIIVVMNCSKSKSQRQKEAQAHKEFLARWNNTASKNEALKEAAITSFSKAKAAVVCSKKTMMCATLGYTAFLTFLPGSEVFAATTGGSGGAAIIKLMQQFSFWIGLGVVIWGIVEAQLDLPGWKGRIGKGVMGYVAILLIPMLFISLRDALQIDVWTKLSEGGK